MSAFPLSFATGRSEIEASGRENLSVSLGLGKKGVSDEEQVWEEDRSEEKESEEARGAWKATEIENGNRGVSVGRRVSVY